MVSEPASRSTQSPPILPSAANTNVITAPNNTAPKVIEAATIILGKSDGARGLPNNFPARLSPIAPPRKLPGSSPKKAKMHPGLDRKIAVAGVPIRLSQTPGGIYRRAPLLGEDTDAVLGMLKLSAAEIAALRTEQVVK